MDLVALFELIFPHPLCQNQTTGFAATSIGLPKGEAAILSQKPYCHG
jgi:hypothetical protein